jgi:hypothetical protein
MDGFVHCGIVGNSLLGFSGCRMGISIAMQCSAVGGPSVCLFLYTGADGLNHSRTRIVSFPQAACGPLNWLLLQLFKSVQTPVSRPLMMGLKGSAASTFIQICVGRFGDPGHGFPVTTDSEQDPA